MANPRKKELVSQELENKNDYVVINDNFKKKMIFDTILPDTSAIIDGFLSRAIESGKLKVKTIILHEAMFAELESQANKNRETGYLGLEELIRLQNIAKKNKIIIDKIGDRPGEFEIKRAKSGEIDNLIRDSADLKKATLITGDIVQSLVAKAKAIPVVLLQLSGELKKSKLNSFFDDRTMSVHLKEACLPKAKKGFPGEWTYDVIGKKELTRDELIELSKSIVEESNMRTDAFIEIQRKGSTIIQLGNLRIVITKPPFSEAYEITAVRPIKKLSLDEYELPEKLKQRFEEQAEGVLISGAPGQGKSTFAQALAEFYNSQGKVVKTVEAPRDLILSNEITQYAISHGSSEEIHDVLLLSRPDYTFFDEMRNHTDFKLFADMRLSGVGMLGVIHATKTIDAIQRFIGKIELGVIPHVIDTVIFIKGGNIENVYAVSMRVKVPNGMQESDLARPVICVNDFYTEKLEFEIYTYGEQTVVMPVSEEEKNALHKLAEQTLINYFKQFDVKCKVEMLNDTRCAVYVSKQKRPAIIGRDGERIRAIEKEIGISVDIRSLDDFQQNDILPNLKVGVSKKKDVVQKSLHQQPKGYSIGFFENKKDRKINTSKSDLNDNNISTSRNSYSNKIRTKQDNNDNDNNYNTSKKSNSNNDFSFLIATPNITINLSPGNANKEFNIFVDGNFLLTAMSSKKAKIKINKKNKIGTILEEGLRNNAVEIRR